MRKFYSRSLVDGKLLVLTFSTTCMCTTSRVCAIACKSPRPLPVRHRCLSLRQCLRSLIYDLKRRVYSQGARRIWTATFVEDALGEKSTLTKHECWSNIYEIRHLSDLSMFSGGTNVTFVPRTNRIMMHLYSG